MFAALALLFAGCRERKVERPIDAEGRVLLLYDNIGAWFVEDVAESGRAVAAGALTKQNQRVVVYQRGYGAGGQNAIYELVQDKGAAGGYKAVVLKQYDAGQYNNLLPATLNAVVADVRSLVPAAHYGIAFGSHGMGWIPRSNAANIARRADNPFEVLWRPPTENDRTRYLAGYGQKIDVTEFAGALDDWDWDFVLLDDCFMASIEALWELRGLATYIISSPTEIMAEGFPYDRVVSRLFATWESDTEGALTNVCQGFIDYYASRPATPWGTISLVKTSGLWALRDAVKALYADGGFNRNVDPVAARVQFYEGLTVPGHVFWDLVQYLEVASTNVALMEGLGTQLAGAVVWAGHTANFFSDFPKLSGGTVVPVANYSGLSTFIDYGAVAPLAADYQKTGWYRTISQ